MIVAISGFAGTGKTSLSEALAEELRKRGLRVELYTPTLRDLAKERGLTLLELQRIAEKEPRIDLELDDTTRRKARELEQKADVVIVASWLAIYVLDAPLKVFLYAPLSVRAERLAARDGITVEEALAHIREREGQNEKRWRELYRLEMGRLHEYAHIALNASLLSLEEEVALLAGEIERRLKGPAP